MYICCRSSIFTALQVLGVPYYKHGIGFVMPFASIKCLIPGCFVHMIFYFFRNLYEVFRSLFSISIINKMVFARHRFLMVSPARTLKFLPQLLLLFL